MDYRNAHPSDEEIARKKKEDEEFHERFTAYNREKQALIELYGPVLAEFYTSPFEIDKAIFFFDHSKRVWLLGHNIPYEDILKVNTKEVFSNEIETTYKTKTDNGNLAKRAIVGGVIGGTTGAVIGASTSSSTTTSTSRRKYLGKSLELILDDMITPSIRISDSAFEIYYRVFFKGDDILKLTKDFDRLCSMLKVIAIKNQAQTSNQTKRKVDDNSEKLLWQNKIEELKIVSLTKEKEKITQAQPNNTIDNKDKSSNDFTLSATASQNQPSQKSLKNDDDNKKVYPESRAEYGDDFQVIDLTITEDGH